MIYVQPGLPFEATTSAAPTGLTGTMGVRIIDLPAGTAVLARTTAGISEQPPGSGIYSVALTAPSAAGSYLVVWDTGGVSPVFASEELRVATSITAVPVPADIRPTVTEVSLLERTRTVGEHSGGLGGDTSASDVTVFDATSRPTAAETEQVIDLAMGLILGRLPVSLPVGFYGAIRTYVALQAAILIETSFFRESLDEGTVDAYTAMLTAGLPRLSDLIDADVAEETVGGFASLPVRSATVAATYPVWPVEVP